jgi:pimeloyl-ACP methyl ester carboxylesterase
MHKRLEEFGGEGARVLFAHANGYPPASYRAFLEQLTPYCQVTGFHQRPLWSPEMPPQRLNWNRFAEDLIETLEATQPEPVWMMGHSMGGTVAAIAAARRPDVFRGLLLIDPVLFSTRRVASARLNPAAMERSPLVRKTLTRPNRFDSRDQAFEFHRGKRDFSRFSDEILWDYILAGTRFDEKGELRLAYAREWEAAAYRSAPWMWGRMAKIKIPVLGLRGESSDTLTEKAFKRWGRLQPQASLHVCAGGHLLPMEQPVATARVIIDYLSRQG